LFPKGVFRISATDTRELTDPRAMRALAHPVRLEILQFVGERGSATATECSREVGESPQACSYHLRALAKYGFVQRAESADGRETRWEMVSRALTFESTASASAARRTAMQFLQSSVLDRDERIITDYLRREGDFDLAWQRAATFSSGSVLVTPEELVQVREAVQKLLKKYERRGETGPPGARRVHVALRAVPRVTERKRKR
jgi:DNA-binding transcriptional ArsR family regulator